MTILYEHAERLDDELQSEEWNRGGRINRIEAALIAVDKAARTGNVGSGGG